MNDRSCVSPIPIVQIGIGHNHGSAKMEALRGLPDLFRVVGFVEDDPKWLAERGGFREYAGLKRYTLDEALAIPGLEAVAVETDGFDLVPTALKCAEKGLHIHMDKPGGQNLAAFRKLLNICEEKHLAFQQAYVYRYNPAIRFMLQAVSDGWLGDLFEIHAVMSRYDGDNDRYRKWLAQFRGGAFYIFAGYLIDLVISMLGEPDSVTSFLKQTRRDGLIDNGLAVLEYPVATATVRVSVEEIDGMKHRRLIICGTNGTLELCPVEAPGELYDSQSLTVRLTLKNGNAQYPAGTHTVNCGPLGSRYKRQLEEFYRIVRNGEPNPYPAEHEYLLHKTLLKACGFEENELK